MPRAPWAPGKMRPHTSGYDECYANKNTEKGGERVSVIVCRITRKSLSEELTFSPGHVHREGGRQINSRVLLAEGAVSTKALRLKHSEQANVKALTQPGLEEGFSEDLCEL